MALADVMKTRNEDILVAMITEYMKPELGGKIAPTADIETYSEYRDDLKRKAIKDFLLKVYYTGDPVKNDFASLLLFDKGLADKTKHIDKKDILRLLIPIIQEYFDNDNNNFFAWLNGDFDSKYKKDQS